jgi:hypothetical protein
MHQMTYGSTISSEMQQCIQDCLECHNICLTTLNHCLHLGGKHAAPEHINLLLECAEICQTSANFMLLNSNLHGRLCAVCAEVCERCAQDCEAMANGDGQMQSCAEVCRRCASSCHKMAQMTA